MNDILTGEFPVALDDKGRISIPVRLRDKVPGNLLHITKGTNRCLWVFPPEEWGRASARWMQNASMPAKRRNEILHRFISPMQEVEMDRTGRIMVPPSLRDYAGLTHDCFVVGIGASIEIWDTESYRSYQESIEGDFEEVMKDTSSDFFYG
ncbi:MAG: division/cell wall cluster transcriptional repressor MraZ [Spirochaetaceae bacterium]|jgi:MraZ protein|nr:division/cell wall cluster transcriptional repressor MraZ [Spirochaetaceae bacterium]